MSKIIHILQTYEDIWKAGLAMIFAVIVLLLLAAILRQIKGLNKSLKSITTNMQAYFDVIMAEEPQTEEVKEGEVQEDNSKKAEALRERDEQEKLFNAVLQEYFS